MHVRSIGAATGTTLLALGLALGPTGAASAHVTVTPSETAAGSYTVLTFSNGHGCEGSPTTAITIQIPEGINAVTPTRQNFYDVSKQTEKLDPPVEDAHGNTLTERVATVTYTAKTPLPDGYRDAFELSLQIPEDAVGETLAFPTIQTCEEGETGWTEIPAEGQDADELDTPAPSFEVTEASGDGHGHSDSEESDGADPAADTGSASEDGGSQAAAEPTEADNTWGYAGVGVGVLGLLVGGIALARSRRTS
jgi:uncharacterized protein YcnI